MKRSLVPVIYDFKRSFLRVSTLVLLVVFIAAGIGLSYLSYHMVSGIIGPVRTDGLIIVSGQDVKVYGVAYDLAGKKLSGAEIMFMDSNGRIIHSAVVNGFYRLSFKLGGETRISRVRIVSGGRAVSEPVLPLGITGNYYVSYYAAYSLATAEAGGVLWAPSRSPGTYAVVSLLLLDKSTGDALLQVVSVNVTGGIHRPSLVLLWGCYNRGSSPITRNPVNASSLPGNIVYQKMLVNDYYVSRKIRLDPGLNTLVIRINGSSLALMIRYDGLQPAKAFMAGALLSSGGLTLFLGFFPIVFLYLAYVLMAKPRATGAMEFILARPVTRWDVYVTRYLSGILVALVSSAIFVLALDAASLAIWGIVLGPYPSTLMFAAVFLGLAAWYSFCYMLSSGIRSSSGYLALAIVFYLLFTMFWGIIVFLFLMWSGAGFTSQAAESLGYKLSLFNPVKNSDLVIYYIKQYYGLEAPVAWINPGVVVAGGLAWIIAPFIIGYMLFRKD